MLSPTALGSRPAGPSHDEAAPGPVVERRLRRRRSPPGKSTRRAATRWRPARPGWDCCVASVCTMAAAAASDRSATSRLQAEHEDRPELAGGEHAERIPLWVSRHELGDERQPVPTLRQLPVEEQPEVAVRSDRKVSFALPEPLLAPAVRSMTSARRPAGPGRRVDRRAARPARVRAHGGWGACGGRHRHPPPRSWSRGLRHEALVLELGHDPGDGRRRPLVVGQRRGSSARAARRRSGPRSGWGQRCRPGAGAAGPAGWRSPATGQQP